MKRIFALTIVCVAALGLARNASAGPERLPSDGKQTMKNVVEPMIQPECNWTGFHIGAHGGYGGGSLDWKDVDFGDNELIYARWQNGFFAGGEVGYDHQFGSFVVGVLSDFDYSWMDSSGGGEKPWETRMDWMGSVDLRLGWAWKHLLFYVVGGGAFAHQEYEYIANDGFKADDVRIAPLIGTGIEYMFTCHWSIKAEYRHIFFGNDDIHDLTIDRGTINPIDHETYDVDFDHDTVTLGLNFKF